MGASLLEAPLTRLSAMDVFSGTLPERMAREAEELGPIMRWPVQAGGHASRTARLNVDRENTPSPLPGPVLAAWRTSVSISSSDLPGRPAG